MIYFLKKLLGNNANAAATPAVLVPPPPVVVNNQQNVNVNNDTVTENQDGVDENIDQSTQTNNIEQPANNPPLTPNVTIPIPPPQNIPFFTRIGQGLLDITQSGAAIPPDRQGGILVDCICFVASFFLSLVPEWSAHGRVGL